MELLSQISAISEYVLPPAIFFPENNIFSVRAGVTRSVSEEYWIILDQLACGFHELRFGGDTYVMDTMEFKTDVTSYLTVNSNYEQLDKRIRNFLSTSMDIDKM